MKLEPRHPEANLGFGFALAGQQKAQEAIAQLQRALEINPGAHEALGEIAMVTKLQLNKADDALNWCNKYKEAKGALDDKDPMKVECTNIEMELKNAAAAKAAMQKMKEMEDKEKAEAAAKQPPAPAPAPAPAPDAAPAPPPK